MTQLTVFITDQIRDEHIRLKLDVNQSIATLIDSLVSKFGLPRRNFNLRPIQYRLVSALNNQPLPENNTLNELRIANREIIHLVSPEARKIWQRIERYLAEIEGEIRDRVTGELKEKVTDAVWLRIKHKLEYLEKTRPDDPQVKTYRRWVDSVDHFGGPSPFMEKVEKIFDVLKFKGVAGGILKIALAASLTFVAVREILPTSAISDEEANPPPIPTNTEMVAPTAVPTVTNTPLSIPSATLRPTEIPPTPELDWDKDRLFNDVEASLGTDPLDPDTDGDNLSDGEEVLNIGTSPLKNDTDGDGYADGVEINQGTDPLNPRDPDPDRDNDGLTDSVEAAHNTDPTNPDTDGDKISDGEEVNQYDTDPRNPDSDGDNLTDGVEVLDSKTNAVRWDTDNDALSDGEEVNNLGTDPLAPDSDTDGLSDGIEVLEVDSDPLDPDTDDDGLSDGDEVKVYNTDPLAPDSDNDGLGDGIEVLEVGSEPLNSDTDNDGLMDGSGEFDRVEQVWNDNADPLDSDTDDDGYGDGVEMEQGTNPLNSQDPPPPQVEAAVRVYPEQLSGKCPVTIEVTGTITLESQTGREVNYAIVRDDGSIALTETTFIEEHGTRDVSTSLSVSGNDGETFQGWVAIQILEPVQSQSDEAVYVIYCQPELQAPEQLSPLTNSVFDHYPRKTTLTWAPVPGASSYAVEVDCYHCCARGEWCTDVKQTWSIEPVIMSTDFTFNFVGAQPGRWRVWANYGDGIKGPKSGWWTFEYTH